MYTPLTIACRLQVYPIYKCVLSAPVCLLRPCAISTNVGKLGGVKLHVLGGVLEEAQGLVDHALQHDA